MNQPRLVLLVLVMVMVLAQRAAALAADNEDAHKQEAAGKVT